VRYKRWVEERMSARDCEGGDEWDDELDSKRWDEADGDWWSASWRKAAESLLFQRESGKIGYLFLERWSSSNNYNDDANDHNDDGGF